MISAQLGFIIFLKIVDFERSYFFLSSEEMQLFSLKLMCYSYLLARLLTLS